MAGAFMFIRDWLSGSADKRRTRNHFVKVGNLLEEHRNGREKPNPSELRIMLVKGKQI